MSARRIFLISPQNRPSTATGNSSGSINYGMNYPTVLADAYPAKPGAAVPISPAHLPRLRKSASVASFTVPFMRPVESPPGIHTQIPCSSAPKNNLPQAIPAPLLHQLHSAAHHWQ
jgi:hypothetical protein